MKQTVQQSTSPRQRLITILADHHYMGSVTQREAFIEGIGFRDVRKNLNMEGAPLVFVTALVRTMEQHKTCHLDAFAHVIASDTSFFGVEARDEICALATTIHRSVQRTRFLRNSIVSVSSLFLIAFATFALLTPEDECRGNINAHPVALSSLSWQRSEQRKQVMSGRVNTPTTASHVPWMLREVNIYDPTDLSKRWGSLTDGFGSQAITLAAEDPAPYTFWIGAWKAGLARVVVDPLTASATITHTARHILPACTIAAMLFTPTHIYVGPYEATKDDPGGIAVLDKETTLWTVYPRPDDVQDRNFTIYALTSDLQERVFAGTNHGLFAFTYQTPQKWERVWTPSPRPNQVPDPSVYAVQHDSQGHLWLYLDEQVYCVIPHQHSTCDSNIPPPPRSFRDITAIQSVRINNEHKLLIHTLSGLFVCPTSLNDMLLNYEKEVQQQTAAINWSSLCPQHQ